MQLRSLTYYWRINLAVAIAGAVACAVLTGALLVGDSVRGSLRDLTLERLGEIDHSLVSERFFREDLADNLITAPVVAHNISMTAPVLLVTGAAIVPGSSARASNVNILGVDERFLACYGASPDAELLQTFRGTTRPGASDPVVINAALQRELGVGASEQIVLILERKSDIHRESIFASTEYSDLVRRRRSSIVSVLPDSGLGRFSLRQHQQVPLNVFVPLAALQRALGKPGEVNAIVAVEGPLATTPELAVASLHEALRRDVTLADLGLRTRRRGNFVSVESRDFVLNSTVSAQILATARRLGASVQPVLTYLANSIRKGGEEIPYSTVAALDPSAGRQFGGLRSVSDTPVLQLKSSEILLNAWAANDLRAVAGDSVDLAYFEVGLHGDLRTQWRRFRVKNVVKLEQLGRDSTLAPEFPGISSARNMSDWEPTFPVDLGKIRPRDEDYWDRYRATPKAFLSLEQGQALWRSRFGDLTSVRIAPAAGGTVANLQGSFEHAFLEDFTPEKAGLAFQAVRDRGLQAAEGATNFGLLFLGLSMFLVGSAALLVGLLFRLGVEQRAREIGLLFAVGYAQKKVQRQSLGEGLTVAAIGCFFGLLGALAYAEIMIYGLRTWWAGAVGTPYLFLHVSPVSLISGFAGSLLIVFIVIWRTVRRLGKTPVPALIAGTTIFESGQRGGVARYVAGAALAGAALVLLAGMLAGEARSAQLFLGSGALLLIGGLAFVSDYLKTLRYERASGGNALDAGRMASRNAALFPGRSMLSVSLVACACFMIVAVGANRRTPESTYSKSSGAGGFPFLAESDIPIHSDLNDPDARYDLGFVDAGPANRALDSMKVFAFRSRPGEDASCLNLYKPDSPTLLGMPLEFVQRGGFSFSATAQPADNPWTLLALELAPDVIPVIGDENSVMWILHSGLGEEIEIENEFGRKVRLRFVALLKTSLFQSELLMSEYQFVRHFPSRSGYTRFLIDVPRAREAEAAALLERTLDSYGMDVVRTSERLAAFLTVENTYLAVFQTLGGLGLLLGTVGLGVVLMRNAVERRRELATLQAFGFERARVSRLLVRENSMLVGLGILIGSVAALIAIAPFLSGRATSVPWLSLAALLFGVFAIGLAASTVAVRYVTRMALLPALKAD